METIIWISFFLMIIVFLALDLGVFNNKAHVISYKEATKWTIIWTALGISFSGIIFLLYNNGWINSPNDNTTPSNALVEYLTGYIIEITLSVDNIFVIAIIFKSFKIPLIYQHRVLFWGIIGALVFRGLMIVFGVVLMTKFSWMVYVFGTFLIYTAFQMALSNDENEFDPKKSFIYKTLRKFLPITRRLDSQKFFIRRRKLLIATPLFLALILVEFTDILFALDSIPAILGITTDPFLVFTSNIFAILGLRSMYFFIANMLDSFHYLKYSLTVILIFVGIKLLLSNHFHLSTSLSLGVILVSLLSGIFYSLKYKEHIIKNTPKIK